MTTYEFKSEAGGMCPCGKHFEVGKTTIDGEEIACLIHEEPYCAKFRDLDVPDYLHWVNVMHGRWN